MLQQLVLLQKLPCILLQRFCNGIRLLIQGYSSSFLPLQLHCFKVALAADATIDLAAAFASAVALAADAAVALTAALVSAIALVSTALD